MVVKTYGMRYLNARDLRTLLPMEEAMSCVEQAYRLHASGKGGLWPVISHVFEPGLRDMDIKSGWLMDEGEGSDRSGGNGEFLTSKGLFGLKVVGYAGDNPVQRGLPAMAGLVVILDVETGHPLGLVDGMALTELRTGAAGAVGVRLLGRPDVRRGLILGSGLQARAQLAGLDAALPSLESVGVAGRNPVAVERFVEEMALRFPRLAMRPLAWSEVPSAARRAEVIVTCTPAESPILLKDWVSPGTHINAVGSDMPEKQELEGALLGEARVFADDREQALVRGECHHAWEMGILEPDRVTNIGDVLLGQARGRAASGDITLFDATGIALQDLVAASFALRKAGTLGMGQLLVA